jgi:cytochrome c-type biogenesis protein CcsB
MFKSFISFFGSMKMMALLMFIFAFSIGAATFIENDFGTQTAKAEVYNARWFELLLFMLGINLAINIFNFKMYRKEKILVFTFHLSFFVVLIGAAITRYVGFEGVMHIRENATQNTMLSSESYLNLVFKSKEGAMEFSKPLYLSKISDNAQSFSVNVNGEMVDVAIGKYIPDAVFALKNVPGGEPIANMMVTGEGMSGPQQLQLRKGEYFTSPDYVIDFESGENFEKPVIALKLNGETVEMEHAFNLGYLNMDDRSSGEINASKSTLLEPRKLYSAMTTSFVLREFFASAKEVLVSSSSVGGPKMNGREEDALEVTLTQGESSERVTVLGSRGVLGEKANVKVGDIDVDVSYGAKVLELPFALKLVDFQLDRYPGSNSPSSYASEVVLIDKEQGIEEPFRIFMNNVLDHRGYRFFQSSYDRDELGTVLSVNNDPGTLPTYLGYLMMGIGMFGALFMRNGRFAKLSKKAKEASQISAAFLAFLAFVTLTPEAKAEELNPIVKTVLSFDKEHAAQFGELMVQDATGRMKPIDSLSTEIVAKVNRGKEILGLTPTQVVLGMMLAPDSWREITMIRTANKELNKIIGIDENSKYSSFSQFFEFPSEMAGYKISPYVDEAIRKAPGKRNKFDKAVLKIDERVNVAYMVYTGSLLRIWPAPNDENNKWMATIEAMQNLQMRDAEVIRLLAVNYFNAVEDAKQSGDWSEANKALRGISNYQKDVGAAIYPSETKIQTEILYNKLNIFERLWPYFFFVGFVLLILSFAKIIKPAMKIDWASKTTMALIILFFIALTAGLGMRWYISGHAPWSDGYESLLYISWATVLAGFIFSKNSPITLAATAILAGLTLFVAHLSWMDPQVTNLVPVLKSYWLTIHVSMITASYGFLGLGALLGFIVLILFNLKSESNQKQIGASIKELNAINEMSLMIGLAMLTIGNFLGGVWANESWGRYWGWDPKETWALVTILVYAIVVHLRFIKPIYSDYSFSAISLLSFTSVIMTYFGVNYYLAGMHSYAKGDPVPIPDFVPITYGIIFAIIILAYRKRHLS